MESLHKVVQLLASMLRLGTMSYLSRRVCLNRMSSKEQFEASGEHIINQSLKGVIE